MHGDGSLFLSLVGCDHSRWQSSGPPMAESAKLLATLPAVL